MKTKKSKLLKTIAFLLAGCMLVGCQNNSAWLDEEEDDERETSKQEQASGQLLHITAEKTVELLPANEKKAWRKPLEEFLIRMIPHSWEDPESDVDYSSLNYGSYAIALFDVTLDGTPEIVVAYPGGSACNVFYYAYDLYSGYALLDFDGGYGEVWQSMYDLETDSLKVIGKFGTQAGADNQMQHITQIGFDSEKQEWTQYEKFYFSYYSVNPTSPDWYTGTSYRIEEKEVSADDYVTAYQQFVNTHLPIVDTRMQLIDWDEVATKEDSAEARAKAMAEALLSTDQVFLKPASN